ncbi:MAG: type II toxin-antitoxin system death-on-curing family toxin [Puniceicoccales bacterium]
MRYLTLEQVHRIHQAVLKAHGGSDGIRDPGLLDAALAMPEATFGGELLHPDIASAAGAYLYHLCQNHPFIDGNKRVGALSAVVFLKANGWQLTWTNNELERYVLQVAAGEMRKDPLTALLRNSIERI